MIFNSKTKSFILFLLFVLVEGMGISRSWQTYQLQPAGVFKVQSWMSGFGIGILILLMIAGLSGWYCIFFQQKEVSDLSPRPSRRIWMGLAVAGGYLALAVAFIHATPLRVFLVSWLTPIWLIGWVVIVQAVTELDISALKKRISLKDVAMALLALLLIKAQQEFKVAAPLNTLYRNWHYIFLAFNSLVIASVWIIKENWSNTQAIHTGWVKFRQQLRPILVLVGLMVSALLPWFIYWLDKDNVGSGAFIRLEWMIIVALILSLLIESSSLKWISFPSVLFSLTWIGFAMMAGTYLSRVTDYPFGLYWSEGNRFYDYSLIFGKAIYQFTGDLQPNYFSPGRYGLWGLPFLISGLPIWAHRLWNAILYLIPGVGLGLLLGKGFSNRYYQWACAFGTAVFFNQGPVYPTLTLSAIILMLFQRSKIGWRILAAIVASLFAGLSRFTWVLAIAGMAGTH